MYHAERLLVACLPGAHFGFQSPSTPVLYLRVTMQLLRDWLDICMLPQKSVRSSSCLFRSLSGCCTTCLHNCPLFSRAKSVVHTQACEIAMYSLLCFLCVRALVWGSCTGSKGSLSWQAAANSPAAVSPHPCCPGVSPRVGPLQVGLMFCPALH